MNKVRKFAMKFSYLILRKISHRNCCHQRSDFKAKMHQIRFWLGSAPDPARSWILRALFLREREGSEREGGNRKRKGGAGPYF